ncbi:pyridoxal 5'-phosphate synthase glutaminase subunit PdxT [Tunturiibacter empetritectus]|uniref:pyridoxal 5'-phosphate synthase glutaminase subunit PdxT n=1 Tax=Tunturiibacter empetritectus TaxID=3069691 RepID=UPI003D9B4AD8
MTRQPAPKHHAPTLGILALQGAYEAHAKTLATLGIATRLIRTPDQLFTPDGHSSIDGLIIPGGESTTMLKFLERNGFLDSLTTLVRTIPTFGTCAGAILLANDVQNPAQISLAALDITIERNAYGRQLDSTILTAPTKLPGGPLEMVFIRAPASPAPALRSKSWPPATTSPSSSARVTSSPQPSTPSWATTPASTSSSSTSSPRPRPKPS